MRLLAGSNQETLKPMDTFVKSHVVYHVHSATGHPQRKGISPGLSDVKNKGLALKYVKGASSVIQLPCVQPVVNVPHVAKSLPVGSRLQVFLANLAENGCRSENNSNSERRVHFTLPEPAKSFKVSDCHKPLCQSSQEQLPVRGITSAYGQKRHRTGSQSNLSRVLQPSVFGSQTQQQMEAKGSG